MDVEVERFELEHASVSRLNQFYRCPYLFKLFYIDEVPTAVHPLAKIGKKSHNYIYLYYRYINPAKLEEIDGVELYEYILRFFEKYLIIREDRNMEIIPVIQGFTDLECERISSLKDKGYKGEEFAKYYLPVLREHKIEFETDLPVFETREFEKTVKKTGEVKMVKRRVQVAVVHVTFRMIVDAVFLNDDGSHVVIDWKTGYRKPSMYAGVNRQLYIYAHYLRVQEVKDRFGNVIDPKLLMVVFPRYTEAIFKERSDRSEKIVLTYMAKAFYQIAKGEFPRKPSMFKCGWIKDEDDQCGYFKEYCEEWAKDEGIFRVEEVEEDREEEDDEFEEDWDSEDWEEVEPDRDFSEGSWDSTEEDDMEPV